RERHACSGDRARAAQPSLDGEALGVRRYLDVDQGIAGKAFPLDPVIEELMQILAGLALQVGLEFGGRHLLAGVGSPKRIQRVVEYLRVEKAAELVEEEHTLAGCDAVPIALRRIGVRIGQGHVAAGPSARQIAAALAEEAQGQLLPVTRLQTARAALL